MAKRGIDNAPWHLRCQVEVAIKCPEYGRGKRAGRTKDDRNPKNAMERGEDRKWALIHAGDPWMATIEIWAAEEDGKASEEILAGHPWHDFPPERLQDGPDNPDSPDSPDRLDG
ncbi:hypothetical protein An16g08350 [Aspergillus niger]|uniref:Uncharacterized protein n=2 Tax=Aspergillus niger TaxID=5061 RepID=A2R8U1_ASPNC|nr:hypothetical protein An16g08350 [Aspergillus niger]CAK32635.1 hypothetical protein An16g08350 [Aspergillus niger]